MDLNDAKRPLPRSHIRLSRRLFRLGLGLVALGLLFAVVSPPGYGFISGLVLAASGVTLMITSGLYWSCDNETCS